MKKILYKLARIIFKYQGYRIALIKASKGTVIIDGDGELLKHVNINDYFRTGHYTAADLANGDRSDYSVSRIATKESYKGPVALEDTKDLETQIAEDIVQALRDIDNEVEYNKSVERYNKTIERLKNLRDTQDLLLQDLDNHIQNQLSKADSSKEGNTVSSIGVRCPNHDIDTQD